jgi:hypothetical protein
MYQVGDYIEFTNEGFFPKQGEIYKIETEDGRTKYGVFCKEFGGDQWHAYDNEDIRKITKEEFEEDFKPYENFANDRKRLLGNADGRRVRRKARKSVKKSVKKSPKKSPRKPKKQN